MLKRISMMRQQESYLGYLKTRQEMLEEIEREWERPKVFDRQIEDVQEARNETSELEDKLSLIKCRNELRGSNTFVNRMGR